MNYFDYLRLTGKKDIKDTFVNYLVEFMDYTKESARDYARFFYNEDGTLKEEN